VQPDIKALSQLCGQFIPAEEPPSLLASEGGQPGIRTLPGVRARLDPPRTTNTVVVVQVQIPAGLSDVGLA
jgi:hypothetical protein